MPNPSPARPNKPPALSTDSEIMDVSDGLALNSGPAKTSRFSLRLALNILILAVVALGLGRTVYKAFANLQQSSQVAKLEIDWLDQQAAQTNKPELRRYFEIQAAELKSQKFTVASIHWQWILAAIPFGIVGILPAGLYWFWTLRALAIHPPAKVVASAYYVGNLGKYVPGKAMVMILRARALRPYGASIALTTISVFVETLTTMAVGAAIGVLALSRIEVPDWLVWLARLSALIAVLPTLPLFFVPVLRQRLAADNPLRTHLRENYTWSLMLRGWTVSTIGWLILGGGLFCVLKAMPQTAVSISATNVTSLAPVQLYVIAVAACSLSVVAGFVSLLPGGAGVRELVLTVLLSPIVGPAVALAVALIHRLVTIVCELILAGLCYYLALPQATHTTRV